MFQKLKGDWESFSNSLPGLMRVDMHFGRGKPGAFWDNMIANSNLVMDSLQKAQEKGYQYVLFAHGYSTARPGQTTTRSIVRAIMKGTASTPFIIKNKSYHHNSVFIARIKSKA
jgi:hypothetical protein